MFQKNRRWECLEVTYRVLQPQSVFLCVNWGKSSAQPPITDEALESSGKHFFKLLVHWFSFLPQILWQFLRSPSPPPFVMHVLSNATKIHKSLFSLYAAIRFFRHHGLPRVRMHKFIVNYHLFSCERFFLCRTAPRAFRFAVKIYHAFSSFETRRRLWRLESVRSFPLNCRVAFRHSVLNFHVRALASVAIVRWSAP